MASFTLGASMASSKECQAWLAERNWFAAEIAPSDVRSYSDVLREDDSVRRRWLKQLPTHQRSVKSGNRWVWVSAEELERIRVSSPSR